MSARRTLPSQKIRTTLALHVGADRARRLLADFRAEVEQELLDTRHEHTLDELTERYTIEAVTLTPKGFRIDVRRRQDSRADHFFTTLHGVVTRVARGGYEYRRHRITGLAERVSMSTSEAAA